MYAIVEIAGQQFRVEKDQHVFVHRLEAKEGSKVDFDRVLLIDNADKVDVGAPVINGAKVTAKVLEHLKGDKVIVFKKKRRKGYKVKNGHRQHLTKLEILKIDKNANVKQKATQKAETISVVKKKKELVKKPVAKKPVAKKPVAKKPVAKKPVAKKSAAKKSATK